MKISLAYGENGIDITKRVKTIQNLIGNYIFYIVVYSFYFLEKEK